MTAVFRKPQRLGTLKPPEVAAYLRANGWRQDTALAGGKASLWFLDGADLDLTLPERCEVADYELRMSEVVRVLATAERRSAWDILGDIETVTADLVRICVPGRDGEDGALPLDPTVSFLACCRDLLLAAACAAIDKRSDFSRPKPQPAIDYLGRVRIQQMGRRSCVLTTLSPVPPEASSGDDSPVAVGPQGLYERSVMLVLMDALDAVAQASRDAGRDGGMTSWPQAVSRGVSADLCVAIVGLCTAWPGDGLDIQASWSRARPVAGKPPSRVFIGVDSIPFIREAARRFRA